MEISSSKPVNSHKQQADEQMRISSGSNGEIGEEGDTEEFGLSAGFDPNGDYGLQSPWNPDSWDGDIEDLQRRFNGPTIHHALKQEIELILKNGAERTRELLHFLDETVSTLSPHDQQRLLAADLSDSTQCKRFMVEF
ncbi:hypothetical protein DVH05_002496 [Phytophthora capsici]|nr:hypothetical protein DVH05_002496 [Phytophthora capsici]